MTKHHMPHVFAIGVGALEGFTNHLGGQVGGGHIFQAATKGTNGGAHTADYNYFTTHHGLLKFEWNLTSKSDQGRLQGADN